jgi:3-oxoacyl-[acyl-carrier protein] reductase
MAGVNKRRLEGKVAIITGGAQGIGRACTLGMSKEGCRVVVADINVGKAKEVVQSVENEGNVATAVEIDISNVEQTLEMAKTAIDRFGKIDILVNNAALVSKGSISRVPFYELDIAEWDRVMLVNLKGTFLCCRAVFPYMRSQGAGKIINVASVQFFHPRTTYSHYIASKGGIVGLTRALAMEMGDYYINVNCIAPGGIINQQQASDNEQQSRNKSASQRALKRIEVPEDIAGTAIFLASSDSDFMTGQTLIVDGGAFMH